MTLRLGVNFEELQKLNKLGENAFPALYKGKLSDPTSWYQWICCCCSKDKDPEHVNTHLTKVIEAFLKTIETDKEEYGSIAFDKELRQLLQSSIAKLESLSTKYSLMRTPKADGTYRTNYKDEAQIEQELRRLRDQLEVAAKANESYRKFANPGKRYGASLGTLASPLVAHHGTV